ncbi:MAG: type VI secretion system baseplate subunit TssF [Candidatus Accumulibacter sp.]|jgi:type VI secretion system protein ImpG|nr:type VI secretion system baseplate subunit TssF [Accumulibacter sp.]
MKLFFEEELESLRVDTVAFAKKYPALAPMLAGASSDPDVERVLEGAAFFAARMREQLSRNAPLLLQNLLRWTFPQALLPLPSMTMMRFLPQTGFGGGLHIPRGTRLASRPVGNVSCLYSTEHDLWMPPAQIAAVRAEQPANSPHFRVSLTINGAPFAGQGGDAPLVLHLAGPLPQAAQRFFVLLRQLDHLEVRLGASTHTLPPSAVRQYFFPLRDSRLPEDRRRNRAYMEVLRYFYLPEQLLFLSLQGLAALPGARAGDGGALEITFCLKPPFARLPKFERNSFLLGVVAASNVFSAFAEPLTVDHTQVEYPLHPQDEDARDLDIMSATRVTGLFPGGRVESYHPYELTHTVDAPLLYSTRFLSDGDEGGRTRYRITPLYAAERGMDALQKHVLSIELICSNRSAPNALRIGDVCLPTDDSPAQARFANITVPTPVLPRPERDLQQWLYLSHLGANLLPQASAGLLRAMLVLYIRDAAAAPELAAANRRCCDAILEFSSEEEDRLIRGRLYRGRRLSLTLDPTGFGSFGSMFLFASALERFFSGFTSINNYARLTLDVAGTGEQLEWPPRMGDRQLG